MPFVLMTVDGSETEPRSVHDTLYGARDAALAHTLDGEDDADWRIQIQNAFLEGFEFARGTARALTDDERFPLDIQWESGSGSYDYRIVEVGGE